MSAGSLLAEQLFVPKHHQRNISSDRVVCMVHEDWLAGLRQRTIRDLSKTRTLSKADASLFLAPSNQNLPKHWSRVCIKVIKKSINLVPTLHNGPLYTTKPARASMEHLVQSARENFRNLWALAHVQYSLEEMEIFHRAEDQLTKVLENYFHKMNPAIYINISESPGSHQASPRHNTLRHDNHRHGNNIISTYAVIETKCTFFLVQPFICSSIKDIISYSPAIFSTSHAKCLFVLYQTLQAVLHLHQSGLNCGDLHLHNVRVDDKLWVQLSAPHVDRLVRTAEQAESISEGDVESNSDIPESKAMTGLESNSYKAISKGGTDLEDNGNKTKPKNETAIETNGDTLKPKAGTALESKVDEALSKAGAAVESNGEKLLSKAGTSLAIENSSLLSEFKEEPVSGSTLNCDSNVSLVDKHQDGNRRVSESHGRVSECENFIIKGMQTMDEFRSLNFELESLAKLTEDWVRHRISNFRYLMILNHLAGRRIDDPNHHPVLPWVMDFSSSSRGFRDLSMSKFRLNKGDSQLDFTYEAMADSTGYSEHIPHHVSDVLSDITYYVYKARRTPKQILCTYVRTKWVPNEYPMSIERMYHWTPDECIPEFFTDSSIFTSIHEDLPDLELPTWCSSAAEFIERHMTVLESDQVSRKLHQWIDLTFGCKLSGVSAVRAKNVYLQLVDQHKNLTNHGVVQLFNHPHPKRVPRDQTSTILPPRVRKKEMIITSSKEPAMDREAIRPETSSIKLPDDFDPTAPMDQFEALFSFTSKATETCPPSFTKPKDRSLKLTDINNRLKCVWRDMQQFGCFMCEMYLANRIQTQTPDTSLAERYNLIGRIYAMDRHSLPRFILTAAEYLLRLESFREIKQKHGSNTDDDLLFEYPIVDTAGRPPPNPALLLQQYSHLLPFPEYFEELYQVLNDLKNVDKEIQTERWEGTKSKPEKRKIEKVMSRKKVELIEAFLQKQNGSLSYEGYELILPYIKELFSDPITTVQAAWSLTGLVGKDVGPILLKQTMLPYLTKLFSGEETTPKHMKLYHRTFLVQLLLYLGLENFLTNFCTLLVEAVAGYKNFIVDTETDTSHDDLDEDDLEENVFLSNQSEMEDHMEPHGSEYEQTEENDDIRPDQTDDYNDEAEDKFDGTDDDILDDEFPCLSNGSASKSGESISNDQISGISLECDSLQENESACMDRESGDTASIHSISHIIEMSMDKRNVSMETDSLDEETRSQTKHSVNFEPETTDQNIPVSNKVKGSYDQSKDIQFPDEQALDTDDKTSTHMIRSETDEFRQIHYSHTINICDVAAESIKWLSHRLGPLLTAKYLSKNLVRMLALCYFGDEQVTVIQDEEEKLPKTTRLVQGDRNALKILECLTYVSSLYGEQVILLQYIPCIVDLIHVARRRLTVRGEAGLVAAVVLLRKIIPLLSDKTFLENLQDSILKDAVKPLLRLVISTSTSFPSGAEMRRLILYKMIDVIYILGLRLGFEMTRHYMTEVMQSFFKPFEYIYSNGEVAYMTPVSSTSDLQHLQSNSKDTGSMDEAFMTIKMDLDTNQYTIGSPITLHLHNQASLEQGRRSKLVKANYSLTENHLGDDRDDVSDSKGKSGEILQSELRETFCPELALAAYIPLTSVFGSHHMEEYLSSDDLIRKLCSQYDKALYSENKSLESVDSPVTPNGEPGDIGSNVAIVGNRICIQDDKDAVSLETSSLKQHFQHKGILRIDPEDTKCKDVEHSPHRHLKGNWLAYWEHELGLNERDTLFNFKQIKLHQFQGHTNSIRSITCLDNENSFISASKDKTVKLWSLASFGDGSGRCRHQWSYDNHKKSVFSVAYLENLRKVASSDSTVHIWDPFTGACIQQLDSTRHSPVIALSPLPNPSTIVVTATTDSTLRFLDIRKQNYAHEYKCVLGSAGIIRALSPSPDGSWVVVGFSTGIVTVLDLNTGMLLGSWKAHEGEILQLKAFNKTSFLSTSFDMSMKLWNIDGKEVCSFKGHTEPVHCVSFYKHQIVSATTSNKIGVHTSVDSQANFSSTKLRSEVFKGVLTSMAILPLNRTLLLGADNGLIRLLC